MDKSQIQVLLIEDNITDAIFLQEALGEDAFTAFEVAVVERLSSAIESLHNKLFDVILLDLGLPDSHGLETFTHIHQAVPQIPKVILSGLADETLATQAVHAGAQDYLVKGIVGFSSAARAIRYAVERQQAQAAVRASEVRFRAMIENGLDDISLLDAEGKLIWESPAVVRNLGYAENEYVGRNLFELVHPDDLAWITGLFNQLLHEPETRQKGIGRLRHANGSWRWIEAVVTNLLDDPSVGAIVVNYRDITERKLNEQKLFESIERFEQLANNIEEAFWITMAHTGEEIYLSPAAEKIWGLPIEELRKPNAFLMHILPEDRPLVEASLARQSLGEKTEIEYRIKRPDGSIHWIWDRSFPIFDSNGKLLSNAGLSTDITDIKDVQYELEVLNHTLETRVRERTAEVLDLYDKAPCGYHSLDENGFFVNVNQTELDWLGYTRDELIGIKHFRDLLTPEGQLVFTESFPRFKEQGWVKDLEFDVICKDGSILPVLLNATASYDADGKFLQSRSTMFEITERRKVELALLRSRDDLSAANVALERAARLKDEFMANMSHELRTPLNAILGLSESLNEQVVGPLNEKQQKYIQTINESGRHLLQLINDILDLAKIEAGQIILNLDRVDLRKVCESSLMLVRQLAHGKNQQIDFEMDEEAKYILADERSLKQMLVNLLSNAIKFSPAGEVLGLVVTLDAAEKKVLLTVWDHGIGIAAKDLEKLFKPFVQLNAGLARETSGTGLGLALVASMARLHGGSVGVESQPEQGSRFTIALPWEPVIETDPLSRFKITGKFRAIDPNAPRQTILLIEDTETVILLVKDFLEVAGYNVEVARNGYDGIALAEKIHPDLILMDVQMPGMDGLETTRRIRDNSLLQDAPIIALTALAMPGDRERCLAAGMDEYISKPINLNSFTKTIRRVLHAEQENKSI